jgi:cellulose synthase/poly-beta-1,6-N-acetylglucosamine synthase-like glycosyltransferase
VEVECIMYLIEVLFWLIVGLLALFYSAYYGLMFSSAKMRNNILKQPIFPKVSLVVPTYNEGKVIQRKLNDILELEYPKEALEVLIVDSGSIDNTLELAKSFLESKNLSSFRLLTQPKREGKASALNYCRPFCNGDIIVLTDADVLFKTDALVNLVAGFGDQSVGAISGKIVVPNASQSTSTKFEKSYRNIFDIIRIGESNIDSTPIFNGPISAFRKDLMDDLNPSTIADDTELSLKVREKGWKAIYEPRALAYERTPANFKSKNKQKIRRGQGIIQSLIWHRKMVFASKYGKYGSVILPSEIFMHVISPLVVLTTIALAILNLVLTPGFLLKFGLLLLCSLVLIILIRFGPRIIGRNTYFNPLEAFATFMNSQFNLIFSMLSLVLCRNNSTWEKIEDVR